MLSEGCHQTNHECIMAHIMCTGKCRDNCSGLCLTSAWYVSDRQVESWCYYLGSMSMQTASDSMVTRLPYVDHKFQDVLGIPLCPQCLLHQAHRILPCCNQCEAELLHPGILCIDVKRLTKHLKCLPRDAIGKLTAHKEPRSLRRLRSVCSGPTHALALGSTLHMFTHA